MTDGTTPTERRFRTQKSVALIGLLALAGGKPVSREWLAETLWTDQEPTWQRNRLRNELSFVTALLGKEVIVRHGNSALSLSVSQSCDLWEFEAIRDSALQDAEPEARIARMREAIAIAERGDLLPSSYEEPILQARERLRDDLRLLLTTLIQEIGKRNDTYIARLLTLFRARFPDEPVPTSAPAVLQFTSANPPVPSNRFWGRATEISLISDWLTENQSPVLTLTGAPGIGKTRLAAQAVPASVWVPCADVASGARLYETIRAAWGIPTMPGQTARDAVLMRLRAQNTVLLLDNLEQIASTVIAPLQDLLVSAPRARCLITSRVPLRIPAEKELRLEPLSAMDSRALFLDRARTVRADFADTEDTEAICALLDGVPLPLELAASKAGTLSSSDIRDKLSDRIRFLDGGRHAPPSKHRSLRAAVEWSVQLLPAPLQQVFVALCVFRGGFTLETAQAFWTADLPPCEETLQTLCAHSLLKRFVWEGGSIRYRLLPTIQAYGVERLAAKKSPASERHARLFSEWVIHPQTAPDFVAWERDYENIIAALSWLEENDHEHWFKMIVALVPFWEARGFFADGAAWCKKAGDTNQEPRMIAWFRMQQSRFVFYAGEFASARAIVREAIRLARQCGATSIEAQALHVQGNILTYHGNPEYAIGMLENACALFTEIGDTTGVYQVWHNLGVAHLVLAQYSQAHHYLYKAEQLARTQGDMATALMSLFFYGDAYNCEERFAEAEPIFARILEEATMYNLPLPREYAKWGEGIRLLETGNWQDAAPHISESADFIFRAEIRWGIAQVCEVAGYYACAAGDAVRAARLLGFAEQWRETVQFPRTVCYVPRQERYVTQLRTLLAPDDFDTFWQEGRKLSLTQAHQLATDY